MARLEVLSLKATRAQHIQQRASQKIIAEGSNRIHLRGKTQMGRERSEKRRWTVDTGNDRLVSQRREKASRGRPPTRWTNSIQETVEPGSYWSTVARDQLKWRMLESDP